MEIAHQLRNALSTTSAPLPSLTWLHTLVTTTRHPPPPLASLLATARTRLLSADLTTPGLLDTHYTATRAFPPNLALSLSHATSSSSSGAGGGGGGTTRLAQDVVVQVLDIEDISKSRWEQVEELEAVARGEGTRGREVVRLPPAAAAAGGSGNADDDEEEEEDGGMQMQTQGQGQQQQQQQQGGGGGSGGKNSTHKLVVQDCKGQKVHAIELKRVERLGVGKTVIGEKILLRAGTVVARGMVLLDPAQCVLLGGKVEAWHRAWVDGRLARLREAVGAERRG
ncbi:hypothetical protein C8A00DRAFT_46415 [Chaetomidium leptoderma]|uniref:RecQ mediated genome instability protein 1-like N-terminal helical domain-containing protein n=1 Tax=Chaetomidium leptoderma TaxID=669021 RepID=A0AAN6VF11_9PEZI|nr:hypothetical protein C8A00DRAFT_46415 [Chaetomidium leptoderma]